MIVSRISEINNFAPVEKPVGWLVRERFNEDGKGAGLEYGCYLTPDIFVSVPIHFSLKDRFIPMNTFNDPGYKYYALPSDMKLAVSTYANKRGKVCPILVAPNDNTPATFISCLAKDVKSPDVIIDATISEGSQVVRKYVDKNRSVIGIIAFRTDRGIINPTTDIELTTGVVGTHAIDTFKYHFETLAPSTVFDHETVTDAVATKFINLPSFIDGEPQKQNDGKHHGKHNKKFNSKKTDNNTKTN